MDDVRDCLDDRGYRRQRLVAALALLQPGIDPVFLVLLTRLNGLALADHGLVVASNQLGMAAGAVLVVFVRHLPPAALRLAALGALVASLATVTATSLEALLATRAVFGFCNGALYAAALATAMRRDPAHAMGTVLLYQLVIATIIVLVLPQVAVYAGARVALAMLAGVAAATLWLMATGRVAEDAAPAPEPAAAACDNGIAAAAACFLFIFSSMMIWSYVGAEGLVAGLSGTMVGVGVALGSVAGGVTALLVARASVIAWLRLPLVAAGGMAALAMFSPFAVPASATGFVAMMVLFNVGSTYAVARFSAHVIARSDRLRRLVPVLHGGGMIIGPVVAAVAVRDGGFASLALVSAGGLGLAVAALAVDVWMAQRRQHPDEDTLVNQKDCDAALLHLDANLTTVQS